MKKIIKIGIIVGASIAIVCLISAYLFSQGTKSSQIPDRENQQPNIPGQSSVTPGELVGSYRCFTYIAHLVLELNSSGKYRIIHKELGTILRVVSSGTYEVKQNTIYFHQKEGYGMSLPSPKGGASWLYPAEFKMRIEVVEGQIRLICEIDDAVFNKFQE